MRMNGDNPLPPARGQWARHSANVGMAAARAGNAGPARRLQPRLKKLVPPQSGAVHQFRLQRVIFDAQLANGFARTRPRPPQIPHGLGSERVHPRTATRRGSTSASRELAWCAPISTEVTVAVEGEVMSFQRSARLGHAAASGVWMAREWRQKARSKLAVRTVTGFEPVRNVF
jgi:hypothetical protein